MLILGKVYFRKNNKQDQKNKFHNDKMTFIRKILQS